MKVVAIIYTGSELTSSAVSEIHKAINDFVVGGSQIVIKKYNEEDLLNLGLKTAVADIKFDNENEAVENPAVYISKKFESVLKDMNLSVAAIHSVLAEPYVISEEYTVQPFGLEELIDRTINIIPEKG